jgi:hypothetical protein
MSESNFDKYWKMFYNYILNGNIIFSIRKPFKKIKFNVYSSDTINYLNYDNTIYENTIIIDSKDLYEYIAYNNFLKMINEDLSKEYKMNNIQFRYFTSHKMNSKVENYYLLGLIDYNIFSLKHHSRNCYECHNLLKLVDKDNFSTNFEQFYFKCIC